LFGRRKRSKKVVVVVATESQEAFRALEEAAQGISIEQREARTTEGVYQSLDGSHLVIADLPELVESGDVGRGRLEAVLRESSIPWVTGSDFQSAPGRWLDDARAASGIVKALPPRAVAMTSLSGGVGKTTLSLCLARYFREKTGLPAAVIELAVGPSGLSALLGGGRSLPTLVDVHTRGEAWPVWEGVTLAPMSWDGATELVAEQVWDMWSAVMTKHVLTVFDAPAVHDWWPLAMSLSGSVYVVTDPRPDALVAATYLADRTSLETWCVKQNGRVARGGFKSRAEAMAWSPRAIMGADLRVEAETAKEGRIVLNKASIAGRIGLGEEPVLAVRDVGEKAARYPAAVGQLLMAAVYRGWRA
jgi:hypothetical protein